MKLPKLTIFVSAWMSGLGFGLASSYLQGSVVTAAVLCAFGGVLAFIGVAELSEHSRKENKP